MVDIPTSLLLSPHHSSSCSATTATSYTCTPTDTDIARETLFAFTFGHDSVHSQELILLHPKRLLDYFDTSYWQLLWIAFVQYLVRILNLLASRELSVLRLPLFEQQRPVY
jgi:hypothetical protein